jgi:hypothetical protein
MDRGEPFHAEVVSADASGGVAFTLYSAGSATSRTLLSTEYVVITDLIFISTAGGTYKIVAGTADAAGKRVAKGNAEALGGLAHHFETPFTCPKGVVPYLIAAAGQVDCVLTGYISQA